MNILDIIAKKRDKETLSKEEIEFFINGYVSKQIPDYQISSLLMAIYLNGLNMEETIYLTKAMLFSGDIVDLSNIQGLKADKHSTGGVGDKVTLLLAPIVSCFGIKMAKMSGRGLGHTGGTLDKLESIPGFSVSLSINEFIKQVNEIGLAVVGQTGNLVPADKLLYALRDVTATVSSIPLIASSIMSKKLASGTDIIILDVKVGNGAFMKTEADALKLAKTMVDIAHNFNKKCVAILTNMNEPLGYAVGNILEVKEAIDNLNGIYSKDLLEVTMKIASKILIEAGLFNTEKEANEAVYQKIESKEALNKLLEMVKYQGGDTSYIMNPNKFDDSLFHIEVKASKEGYIEKIDALEIGLSSMQLGAGRRVKTDLINPRVGVLLKKKQNDYVKTGDILAVLYADKEDLEIVNRVEEAFIIGIRKEDKLIISEVN